MDLPTIIIITFVATAIYDAILRLLVEKGQFQGLGLGEYYTDQTLLTVMLTAGIIGAVTQIPIYFIVKAFPDFQYHIVKILLILLTTFIVSGLAGFVIKLTNLFPLLEETYYKTLGWKKAFLTDGLSGVIVNITLMMLLLDV
jgi:hypothetical protein